MGTSRCRFTLVLRCCSCWVLNTTGLIRISPHQRRQTNISRTTNWTRHPLLFPAAHHNEQHHITPPHLASSRATNEIWRLVLILPARLDLDSDATVIHKQTSLLKTCRQTREEASSLFYGENEFSAPFALGQREHLLLWLSAIGSDNARHIRSLEMRFRQDGTDNLKGREVVSFARLLNSTTAALARSIAEQGVPPSSVRGIEHSPRVLGSNDSVLAPYMVGLSQKKLRRLAEKEGS